ncbi:MAG: hypothetical protein ACRDJE_11775 [Dehalococcoidia bacterium]
MAEQMQETSGAPTSVPARIQLDDFIEAVSRGVFRALQAEEEVRGYGGPQAILQRPILIGIWFDRTGGFGGVQGLPGEVQGGGVPGVG